MKLATMAIAAVAISATLALPTQAEAQTRTVHWVCQLEDGQVVTFVTAAEAARYGIELANSEAGVVFATQFGEDCHVA